MESRYPTLANGRYEVSQCIGIGGMAAVFKCYDSTLLVNRAVKVLKPEYIIRNKIRERFKTEAIAMANLNHPNVVHVYDHGLEGLTLYIVMEYLPQGSLQQYIETHGALNQHQAVSVCRDIARALKMAHRSGIIHRDIKPDNILLHKQGCKVADFGIARDSLTNRNSTHTQADMGTFPFMSPEQRLSAKKSGPQSDIYALAASLFVILTLGDPTEIYDEKERAKLTADLPESIQDIINKGCCTDINERYQNVDELINDLEALLEGVSVDEMALLLEEELVHESSPDLDKLLHIWREYTGDSETESRPNDDQNSQNATDTFHFEETWEDTNKKTPELESEPSVVLQETELISKDKRVQNTTLERITRQMVWFVLFIVFLIAIALTLLIGKDYRLTPEGPEWEYEGTVELLGTEDHPITENSNKQFRLARKLFLNGDLTNAAQTLDPLLEQHPNDSTIHNLLTMIEVLHGEVTLPPTLFDGSKIRHASASSEYKLMLDLINRSWMLDADATVLQQEWDSLLQQTSDPLVEFNYVLSMRFLLGKDFVDFVDKHALKHTNSATFQLFKILAAELYKSPEEALSIAQKSHTTFPLSSAIELARIRQFLLNGKFEVADEVLKQLLIENPNSYFGNMLSVYHLHKIHEYDASQNNIILGIGDTTPMISQLVFLDKYASFRANAGQLHTASKVWNFCIDQSSGTTNYQYMGLQCLTRRIEATIELKPFSDWAPMVDEYKKLLESSNLHPTLETQFNRFLLYLMGRNAIAKNNLVLANDLLGYFNLEVLDKLQNESLMNPTPSPYSDAFDLRNHLILAKGDLEEIDRLYRDEELRLSVESPTCKESYFQYKLAQKLQSDEAKDHQSLIMSQECIPVNWTSRIFEATMIIEALEDTPDNLELIERLKKEWPGFSFGNEDRELELSQRARKFTLK